MWAAGKGADDVIHVMMGHHGDIDATDKIGATGSQKSPSKKLGFKKDWKIGTFLNLLLLQISFFWQYFMADLLKMDQT